MANKEKTKAELMVEFEKMSTTELIDFHESERYQTEKWAADTLYEVLDERKPFSEIYAYINELNKELKKQVEGQQVAIDKLKRHKHDKDDGSMVVPI